jgi:hypothetical protein
LCKGVANALGPTISDVLGQTQWMHDLILRSVNGWIWIPLSDREGCGEHQQSQDVEQALQAPEVQTQLHPLSSVELMSHLRHHPPAPTPPNQKTTMKWCRA